VSIRNLSRGFEGIQWGFSKSATLSLRVKGMRAWWNNVDRHLCTTGACTMIQYGSQSTGFLKMHHQFGYPGDDRSRGVRAWRDKVDSVAE
jgi:hypothetical protein